MEKLKRFAKAEFLLTLYFAPVVYFILSELILIAGVRTDDSIWSLADKSLAFMCTDFYSWMLGGLAVYVSWVFSLEITESPNPRSQVKNLSWMVITLGCIICSFMAIEIIFYAIWVLFCSRNQIFELLVFDLNLFIGVHFVGIVIYLMILNGLYLVKDHMVCRTY